jgi:PAS domain S-box-containing protein
MPGARLADTPWMLDGSLEPLAVPADRQFAASTVARAASADGLAELVDLVGEPTLAVALRAVREMLGMDVAYVSEIVGDDMILREFEGDGESFRLAREVSLPLEQTYCQRMLDGRIPNLIPDVVADDRTASLPITQGSDIGAFATVALTFGDGRVYGTLCAASHEAKALDYRELQFLKVFARLIADQLEREEANLAISELAALVNAADDGIMGLTLAGVVTSWNTGAERIFGYSASEAIGHDIIDLIGLPGSEERMRQSLKAAGAGEVFHREGRRRRADGTIIATALTLTPIRDDRGKVILLSAFSRDISDELLQAGYRAVERDVVSSLESASDAHEAAVGTLRGMGEGLGCEIGVLWEIDETEQRLRCSALWVSEQSAGADLAQSLYEESFHLGEELPGRIWASGGVVWTEQLGGVADSARAARAVSAGMRAAGGLPVRTGGEVVGVIEFFSHHETAENAAVGAMGDALAGRLADALGRHRAQEALRDANYALEIRVRERTTDLQRVVAELDAAQIETVQRLSRAVEFRDEDTGAHIARISTLAERLARRAGLDSARCKLIERASPLHDVGKVAIPDSVLLMPGPLTPAERSVIATHAEIGHRLLAGSDSAVLQMAATIALTHHEHYDGCGYPGGLAGKAIPIEGRIVAIADVFDALTSDRVYRSAMTNEQALAILRVGRGTHFDPELLDHFIDELEAPAHMEPSPG